MTARTAADPARSAPLARLAAGCAGLAGWRRLAVAAALGASTALALPPVYLVPLLVPAVVGLLWLTAGTRRVREAFWVGWAFGLGHFAAGLYWIGIAFFVDAARHAWMMPFAVLGLAAGLAIFKALMLAGLRALPLWRADTGLLARVLALAGLWCLAEWVRGQILTGFPWNLAATVWAFDPAPQQLAAALGAWGLSLVTVLAAGLPALVGWARPRAAWSGVAAAVLLVGALWGGGALRLAAAPEPGAHVQPDVRLRLVQPGIPQHLKWRDDLRLEHVRKHVRLTRRDGFERITHVVWPETAVPYFLSRKPDLRAMLGREAVPAGGALLTGVPRLGARNGKRVFHNALVALGPEGATLASYDKVHLVPFGEYVPLRRYLPLPRLAEGAGDFTPGTGHAALETPGLPPFSVLICYEAIFPDEVVKPGARPAWLLNVTNDAWFGVSSGPYQHLASARLRAVEQGLPLVRAANTGISTIVDPWGRTLARLDLQREGVLDGPLPRPLAWPTPYARFGDLPALVLALLACGAALGQRRR
jgi:apolipoprotein N-acyltransferase